MICQKREEKQPGSQQQEHQQDHTGGKPHPYRGGHLSDDPQISQQQSAQKQKADAGQQTGAEASAKGTPENLYRGGAAVFRRFQQTPVQRREGRTQGQNRQTQRHEQKIYQNIVKYSGQKPENRGIQIKKLRHGQPLQRLFCASAAG